MSPFWVHFGSNLDLFCGPIWSEKEIFLDPKRSCFWTHFGSENQNRAEKEIPKIIKIDQNRPENKFRGRKRKFFLGLNFVQNRSILGQNDLKSAYFGPKSAFFGPFWPILSCFLRNRRLRRGLLRNRRLLKTSSLLELVPRSRKLSLVRLRSGSRFARTLARMPFVN